MHPFSPPPILSTVQHFSCHGLALYIRQQSDSPLMVLKLRLFVVGGKRRRDLTGKGVLNRFLSSSSSSEAYPYGCIVFSCLPVCLVDVKEDCHPLPSKRFYWGSLLASIHPYIAFITYSVVDLKGTTTDAVYYAWKHPLRLGYLITSQCSYVRLPYYRYIKKPSNCLPL